MFAANYKEIKYDAGLNNAYKSTSLGHSISLIEEVNGEKRRKRRKKDKNRGSKDDLEMIYREENSQSYITNMEYITETETSYELETITCDSKGKIFSTNCILEDDQKLLTNLCNNPVIFDQFKSWMEQMKVSAILKL